MWRYGELVEEPTDVRHVWRDDLVSFALGCSFSFEQALVEEGIELRHMTCGSNVPMYRTNIRCVPAGPFAGPLVVSMRPLSPADAIRAIQITSRFPSVHGAPVHIGLPEAIGIEDLAKPDYGDSVPVGSGELPVFWACGVTPQAVIAEAEARILHHPRAGLDADHRSAQRQAGEPVAVAGDGGDAPTIRALVDRIERADPDRCRAQHRRRCAMPRAAGCGVRPRHWRRRSLAGSG